ncbi:hypothetical protein DESA109040_02365 [Deinococcus saxicola]|uniref:hypothetical protein n=1 Tax=Deinococcus saxicola TaxID=249406 RepID=UPI0039EF2274
MTAATTDLNHQIQTLLDQARDSGTQVRVQWTLTHDAHGRPLTGQRPVSVILGRDRLDCLGGEYRDTGSALELIPDVVGRPVLTALIYRAGDDRGPQRNVLEGWGE